VCIEINYWLVVSPTIAILTGQSNTATKLTIKLADSSYYHKQLDFIIS